MRVTKPVTTPCVTLAEVKNYLRIDHPADDEYIEDILIPAAQDFVERNTGYMLSSGTVVINYDSFDDPEPLPYAPVTSLTSVVDSDGADVTDGFTIDSDTITGADGQKVTVSYVAGYTTPPVGFKDLVLTLCAYRYENRGDLAVPVQFLTMMQRYARLMPL